MRMIAGTLSQAMPGLVLVKAAGNFPTKLEDYDDEYYEEEYEMREDTPTQG